MRKGYKKDELKQYATDLAGTVIGVGGAGTLVSWKAVGVAGALAGGTSAIGVPLAATLVGGGLVGLGATQVAKKVNIKSAINRAKEARRMKKQTDWALNNYFVQE